MKLVPNFGGRCTHTERGMVHIVNDDILQQLLPLVLFPSY
jgi:hypothetical protein